MKDTFTQIVKDDALARIAAYQTVIAQDVADEIMAAHPSEAALWSQERTREHVVNVIERLLRSASELPAPSGQIEFVTESFKKCFTENPALPACIGVPQEDGRMAYQSPMKCTRDDLKKAIDYRNAQIVGMQDGVRAMMRFVDWLDENGIESNYLEHLNAKQAA